jgi:hypothetical protein
VTLASVAAGLLVAVAALPAMHDWTRLHHGGHHDRAGLTKH